MLSSLLKPFYLATTIALGTSVVLSAGLDERLIAQAQASLLKQGIDTEVLSDERFHDSACRQFRNDGPEGPLGETFIYGVAVVKADRTETREFCIVSSGRLVPAPLRVKGPPVQNYESGPRLLLPR